MTKVVGGTRQKLSMMSTVTHQGEMRWMITDGAFNHEKFIEFLQSLVKDVDQKAFLILDNLGVPRCKPVKAYLAEHTQQIEAFFLPRYSPELNPDERLNADLKQVMDTRVPARTKPKREAAVKAYMEKLETGPHRVRTYFQVAYVRYAAWPC